MMRTLHVRDIDVLLIYTKEAGFLWIFDFLLCSMTSLYFQVCRYCDFTIINVESHTSHEYTTENYRSIIGGILEMFENFV